MNIKSGGWKEGLRYRGYSMTPFLLAKKVSSLTRQPY